MGRALAAASALPFAPALTATASQTTVAGAESVRRSSYFSLSEQEAAFVEAMVAALYPADDLTPDGVVSAVAASIDAQLSSDTVSAVHGQRALFKAGIAAADEASSARLGRPFARLAPADARRFLRDVQCGDVPAEFPLASWYSDVVEPLLKQACFAGSVYEAHGASVFWKLFA
jgi:gluconate 2-dehydrogenase gamma chain